MIREASEQYDIGKVYADKAHDNRRSFNLLENLNIECQSGSNTICGVRNIRHFGNSFMNVNIWDIGVGGRGATISNIHQDARGTVIISGIMTGQNFSNQGQGTKIIDENNGLI